MNYFHRSQKLKENWKHNISYWSPQRRTEFTVYIENKYDDASYSLLRWAHATTIATIWHTFCRLSHCVETPFWLWGTTFFFILTCHRNLYSLSRCRFSQCLNLSQAQLVLIYFLSYLVLCAGCGRCLWRRITISGENTLLNSSRKGAQLVYSSVIPP